MSDHVASDISCSSKQIGFISWIYQSCLFAHYTVYEYIIAQQLRSKYIGIELEYSVTKPRERSFCVAREISYRVMIKTKGITTSRFQPSLEDPDCPGRRRLPWHRVGSRGSSGPPGTPYRTQGRGPTLYCPDLKQEKYLWPLAAPYKA